MITIARPEVHDLLTVGLAVLFGAGLSGILFLVGMFFSAQFVEWRRKHGYYVDRRGRPKEPVQPDMRLVRLDPLNVWEMRAYKQPVDAGKPLHEMSQPYIVVALVTIIRDRAFISMTMAKEKISHKAYRCLKTQLKYKGVNYIDWDRHHEDGTVRQVRGST